MREISSQRIAQAFALGPALGILVISFILGFIPQGDGWLWHPNALLLCIVGIPVAYVSTLLFGLPLFWALKKIQWLSLWPILIGGGLCGMPFAAWLWFGSQPEYQSASGAAKWFLSMFGFGMSAALAFWVVAFRSRSE